MSIAVGLAWAAEYRRQASEEIARLRLTGDEREAVAAAIEMIDEVAHPEVSDISSTLRGLLDRTQTVEK